MTPFRANYGFNPVCNIDAPPILLKDNALILTKDCPAHFDALRVHLTKAKEDFKKYSDSRKAFRPSFKVGDLVWLKGYLIL